MGKGSARWMKPVDMTTGTPWKKILEFSIPMLLGNIAQQLYNTVDSIVVGRYIGDNALAAVGSAGPILNLLIVLFVGISIGASIVVAQYLGARDRESLSWSVGNCIILILAASALVTLAGLIVVRPLLVALNTPDTIIDWCAAYLSVMFAGSVGLAFYNILSGVLRGLGDSISALLYLVISSVINIVLDVYFVAVLHLGVPGVAYATIIAQAFSGILCILRLTRMTDMFDMKWKYFRWKKRYGMGIIRLGIPSGITQAILSMAMILCQNLTNSYGEAFIAANVMLQRVDGFAMLPNLSFGTAFTTYAGQNIGAKDMKRVQKGARQGLLLSVLVSLVITSLILIFGKYLMHIFTDTQELVDMSMQLMRILAAGYIAMAVIQTLGGIMRGAGDTMTPMWISIVQIMGVRVPLAYFLCYATRSAAYPIGRKEMLYVSLLIAWIFGAVISAVFYKRGRWKNRAITT